MEYLFYFVASFFILYLLSYIVLVRKSGKKNDNNKEDKIPVEVQYLVLKYKIDVAKLNYRKFLNTICLVGSLDMAITFTTVMLINNIYLQLLAGFVIITILILLSYGVLGKYYVKKGMIKNEYTRNRK